MAGEKISYPKIVKNAWFYLRDRAQKSPNTKITVSFVRATLSLGSDASARDNIVSPLTKLGLIDDNGALTELGGLWRNDETYADACQKIAEVSYPEDLRAIDDVAAVERWFTAKGFGASNARQMTATYKLLTDPSIPDEVVAPGEKRKGKANGSQKRADAATTKAPKAATTGAVESDSNGSHDNPHSRNETAPPSLQMNLQIHLPSNATAEQIDTIFASMAKHLYGK
jgi:hypothetical protein